MIKNEFSDRAAAEKVFDAAVDSASQTIAKPNVMRLFRVNVLHSGKERWKYCGTIERAKHLQQSATAGGLCSIIYEKVDGSYVAWGGA